jgi:hypothetical protein
MNDTSDGDGLAGKEQDDLGDEQHDLMAEANSLVRDLESLIDNVDDHGSGSSDPSGLTQRKKAALRVLRMQVAEVEALSGTITKAQLANIKGGNHGR